MKRKHTTTGNTFPIQCEYCEETIQCQKDVKRHMKTHSFIQASYKCVECEFVGENQRTMEVHLGKYHSEIFECNLCDYEALSLENLETHLYTCEIYECRECKLRGRTLSELKTHMENQHAEAGKTRWGFPAIIHTKMDREKFVEVTSKAYYVEDL